MKSLTTARANVEIKIWPCEKAPKQLKELAGANCEWIAIIPRVLASPEIEALFQRWETPEHPVHRHTLQDGSIMFNGSCPALLALHGPFRTPETKAPVTVRRRRPEHRPGL
jgi:hypothetical protein